MVSITEDTNDSNFDNKALQVTIIFAYIVFVRILCQSVGVVKQTTQQQWAGYGGLGGVLGVANKQGMSKREVSERICCEVLMDDVRSWTWRRRVMFSKTGELSRSAC